MKTDITIKISGEAGQGLQTMGQLIVRALARSGLNVFANQVLQSRIRGGHNWFQIRVSDAPVLVPCDTTDILVALDNESSCHLKELKKDSIVIFDSSSVKITTDKGILLDLPLEKIARESAGNKLMSNMAAVGAVCGLLEFETNILSDLIRESLGLKGRDIAELNIKAAQAGYDYVYKKVPGNSFSLLGCSRMAPKMLLGASESIALGALAAGCKFISAYPMSPSTGIMTYLASKSREFGIVVEQSEDENSLHKHSLGRVLCRGPGNDRLQRRRFCPDG